jgi:hypothetical protein
LTGGDSGVEAVEEKVDVDPSLEEVLESDNVPFVPSLFFDPLEFLSVLLGRGGLESFFLPLRSFVSPLTVVPFVPS